MSTDAAALDWRLDNPWRRLPWTLPGALGVVAITLWALASFMAQPAQSPEVPPPIDAQIVELPPPPAPVVAPPKPEQPKPVPKPLKPHPTVRPQVPVHVESAPAATESSVSPAPPAPPPPRPAPAQTQGGAALSGNSGAQAIVRPLPNIPDDLRDEAMDARATARFHVAVDGSATVELARPTQNPRLNRLLLETLKTWRFFPAMKDGKPVPSIEEIVIRFQVR